MGKSSKKRKRAEKAAAASLVLSEQPEESAMDVEANINIIRPMDSLKPGEFKRLVLKSLDDSIAMYKSLKRQGKEKYMKYFFTSNWQESLYERLRINRVEDGKPALFGVEDDDLEETNFDYYLPTKESHQYAILWDKLQFLLEKKEWDWSQKLDFANSIVATEKLDLLYGCHVQACIEDVLGSQDDMKAAQQLEYYRYLFKNEAKCFYPSGKKCDQNELLGIMKEFEFIYWETMKTGFPLPCGKYYKVKQQLALDLGIVKYDSKGFLMDNYNSSEWKIP